MQELARSGRRHAQHGATSRNTPRTIRSRLAFPRRQAKPADAAAAPEVVQQVARSPSGRTALGPWLGGFGSMEQGLMGDDPPSPTLFATSAGRVFANLAGAPVDAGDLVAEPEAGARAAGAPGQHDARDARDLVVARAEVKALRAKEEVGRRKPMPARAARFNNQLRRQRRVMQARKQNS